MEINFSNSSYIFILSVNFENSIVGLHVFLISFMLTKFQDRRSIVIVRTSFGLDPKTGLGSGPTSPNNEFVEHGRKN